MKITQEEKQEILDGLLPELEPNAVKYKTRTVQVKGVDLLHKNILVDKQGKPVVAWMVYNCPEKTPVPVNHKLEIGQIIADAKNREEMETALARYLATYSIHRPSKQN
jgi:hypothetical protein